VRAFDAQRPAADWSTVWLGLLFLAVVDALGVAYVIYGPDAAAGYSSLPVGPKLRLPPTPLLPLAALAGSIAQFFIFSGLLYLSARLLRGHGSFKTQSYLLTLCWVPLLLLSDIIELIPPAGSYLGLAARLYALCLCPLALAAAHRFSLSRAWSALLLPVLGGLLLGLAALALVGPHLSELLGNR
jgi:hypothetical protein